jgi:hypothetical protein
LADPEIARALPRVELKTDASLVQGSPKRNTVIGRPSLRSAVCRESFSLNAIYSIVTASRPISLASSSKWSES